MSLPPLFERGGQGGAAFYLSPPQPFISFFPVSIRTPRFSAPFFFAGLGGGFFSFISVSGQIDEDVPQHFEHDRPLSCSPGSATSLFLRPIFFLFSRGGQESLALPLGRLFSPASGNPFFSSSSRYEICACRENRLVSVPLSFFQCDAKTIFFSRSAT